MRESEETFTSEDVQVYIVHLLDMGIGPEKVYTTMRAASSEFGRMFQGNGHYPVSDANAHLMNSLRKLDPARN